MRRILMCWPILALLSACHAPDRVARFASGAGSGNKGETVTLDDATNELHGFAEPGFVAAEVADAGRVAEAVALAQRMLIEGGRAEVEVARLDEATDRFLGQVVAWGGHLQKKAITARQDSVAVTVRVPAARFDDAFTALREIGRMLSESRQAEDVTEEFVDLGIRLDTARKARDRLLEVLAKAEKVADVLAVEAELRRLTEEIERMEGRRKFLMDRVALATLEVLFRSPRAAPGRPRQQPPSRFPWINRVGPDAVMGDF